MNSIGLFCQNFSDFQAHEKGHPKNLFLNCVVSIDELRQNVYSSYLISIVPQSSTLSVIIDPLNERDFEFCKTYSILHIFFHLKETIIIDIASSLASHLFSESDDYSPIYVALTDDFELWHKFSTLISFNTQVLVSPTLQPNIESMKKWASTNLSNVIITNSFFPSNFVLPPPIEKELGFLIERGSIIFLPTNIPDFKATLKACLNISLSHKEDPTQLLIQKPMETIKINLKSSVYETFEKDKLKYDLYENAIKAALSSHPKGKDAVVAIVGAGRGPLVDAALHVGASNIFVVEKNKNLLPLLLFRAENEWPSSVNLIMGDMREVEISQKVDIIISELLGGFGDNELSPECLINCERFLSDKAISIPTQYSSFLAPISSQHIWSHSLTLKNGINSMLVSKMGTAEFLGKPKKVFEFLHPGLKQEQLYLTKTLEFEIETDGILHGFCGFFESKLFNDIIFSTSPIESQNDDKKIKNQLSWFPVFFPIQFPFKVKKGDSVQIVFSRKCNNKFVWYEWTIISPELQPIQNPGGTYFNFTL